MFTGSEDELRTFSDHISRTAPTLHFTMEYSNERIYLLDLLITANENRKLETSIRKRN